MFKMYEIKYNALYKTLTYWESNFFEQWTDYSKSPIAWSINNNQRTYNITFDELSVMLWDIGLSSSRYPVAAIQ